MMTFPRYVKIKSVFQSPPTRIYHYIHTYINTQYVYPYHLKYLKLRKLFNMCHLLFKLASDSAAHSAQPALPTVTAAGDRLRPRPRDFAPSFRAAYAATPGQCGRGNGGSHGHLGVLTPSMNKCVVTVVRNQMYKCSLCSANFVDV